MENEQQHLKIQHRTIKKTINETIIMMTIPGETSGFTINNEVTFGECKINFTRNTTL